MNPESKTTKVAISVRADDFSVDDEYQSLTLDNTEDGAVVMFVGRVRDFNQDQSVSNLTLEHYPAMTEKVLHDIAQQAQGRWRLNRISIIHRVGDLSLSDQIVFVGVTSSHREDAFASAQFLMDYLKTKAPFWKKETTSQGQSWLSTNDKDQLAADKW
jgi:molybdopterin synthase catalytic subunit